ncbi:MAG: thioredoxin family protein [Gammaproteobacteria bacterium]|nr:thioredoxin family protein [Gammaproteobacteria bacterium]
MRKYLITSMLMVIIVALCCSVTEAKVWKTDFKRASSKAKSSGKYMLLNFSGSDWCGWCKKLDKEVFSKSTFKRFASKNLVCVLVDFPRSKRQSARQKQTNADLARRFGVRGYPTVLILGPDGRRVAKTGYRQGGAKEYTKYLKQIIKKK